MPGSIGTVTTQDFEIGSSGTAQDGAADPRAGLAEPVGSGASDELVIRSRTHLLRFATEDDAAELFELGSDPAVTRFFSWGPYASPDEPLAYVRSLSGKREDGSLLEFVVVDRDSDEIVGVTGLTEFSLRDRRAVVGSWLGHRHWGSGANFASKALVLALGFRHIGLERISAYCHVRNGRSKTALERIGFHSEGVLKSWHWHRGEPQDVHLYCLLREQYMRTEAALQEVELIGNVPPAFRLDALDRR